MQRPTTGELFRLRYLLKSIQPAVHSAKSIIVEHIFRLFETLNIPKILKVPYLQISIKRQLLVDIQLPTF